MFTDTPITADGCYVEPQRLLKWKNSALCSQMQAPLAGDLLSVREDWHAGDGAGEPNNLSFVKIMYYI